MLNLLAYLHCNHIALKPAPCWHVRLSLVRESSFPLHHQLSPSDGSSPWETDCSLSHLEGKSTTNRTLLAQYPSWRFSLFLYSPLESVPSRRTVIYSAPFPSLILSWIHPVWLLSHPFTESTLLQVPGIPSGQRSVVVACSLSAAGSQLSLWLSSLGFCTTALTWFSSYTQAVPIPALLLDFLLLASEGGGCSLTLHLTWESAPVSPP